MGARWRVPRLAVVDHRRVVARAAEQWQRVLLRVAADGARVEVRIGQRFNVLNTITWQKPPYSTKAEMCDKSTMRGFFPASERIIFAEHYFEPLRLYLASGVTVPGGRRAE